MFLNTTILLTGLHSKTGEEALFGIEDFLQMRSNEKAFFQFCDHILPCVVGKKLWDKSMGVKHMSGIATTTDEAWALLVLENSWDVWKQQARSPNGKVELKERRSTKWTNTSSLASRSEGWGQKGMRRFNELVRKVKEDRQRSEGVEQLYMESKQDESDRKAGKQKRKRQGDYEKEDVECSFPATMFYEGQARQI